MMRWSLLILACLAFGIRTAAADPITLRGGEHEGFTRLVLTLPDPATGWQVDRVQTGYRLSLETPGTEFDTTTLFDRIRRDRLSLVRTDDSGGLYLDTACRCRVRAYRFKDDYLVLDISETDGPLPPIVDTAPKPMFSEALPLRFDSAAPNDGTIQPQLSLAFSETISTGDPSTQPTFNPTVDTTQALRDPTSFLTRRQTLYPAQRQLIEDLKRAADQGLLNLPNPENQALRPRDLPTEETRQAAKEEPGNFMTPRARSAGPKTRQVNISAVSSIDQSLEAVMRPLTRGASEPECLPESLLAVESWVAEDVDPFDQVSGARRTLFGEFDRPDDAALLTLIRTYIYLGFGAEARQALMIRDRQDLTGAVLAALADIIESEDATARHSLLGQEHCAGPATLWAFLATESADQHHATNAEAMMRSFNALPSHLRRLLAPELGTRLAQIGATTEAHRVLAIARRGQADFAPALDLTTARLHLTNDATDQALATLDPLLQTDTPQTPEALVASIDARLATGKPLTIDQAALAAALALEHRATAHGPSLRRVHILARAALGDFYTAFTALSEVRELDGAEVAEAILPDLFGHVLDTADDFTFVDVTLRQMYPRAQALPASQAQAAVERLLDLGFPKPAADILDFAAIDNAADHAILAARIALQTQRPAEALAHLADVEGTTAEALRAQAYLAANQPADAQHIFAALTRPEDAENAAWLAGDWDHLSRAGGDLNQQIATLARERHSLPPDGQALKNLTPHRGLLQRSEATRTALAQLLDAHPLSGDASDDR